MELKEPGNNKHGQLTAKVAREISPYWEERGYQVLYDHDPASDAVGKVVSSFGDLPYHRSTQLSQIDIAIVRKVDEWIFAVIEIEETSDKPKTILGDVLGVLMGEHVSFGKKRSLVVDQNTLLLVVVKSKAPHDARNKYLLDQVVKARSSLHTANSVIKRISIESFSKDAELSDLLPTLPRNTSAER